MSAEPKGQKETSLKLVEQPVDTSKDFVLEEPVWDLEKVDNWEERIESYTPKQKELYKRMIPTIDQAFKLKDSSGWKSLVKDDKKKVYIESQKSERGFAVMRATGPINYSPLEVWRAVNFGDDRKQWDDNCDVCRYTGKVGVNAYTSYSRANRVLFVAARDFVME